MQMEITLYVKMLTGKQEFIQSKCVVIRDEYEINFMTKNR